MVLVGPLVLFGLLRALGKKKLRPLLLTLSGALMYAGGKGISALFSHMGGLVTRGLPMHLLAPEAAAGRLAEWADQFGVLLDAPLVSSPATVRTTYVRLLALLYAAALVYGIVRFLRLSWRRQLLLITAVLNIGGCLFTDVAITHRYIVPAFYFGFLLLFLFLSDAAEQIADRAVWQESPAAPDAPAPAFRAAESHRPAASRRHLTFWRAAAGLLISFCLLTSVSFGADKCSEFAAQPALGGDEQRLADFIAENDLGDGYANFWNASVIAYYADFDFQVYPVYTGTGSGAFVAYPELIRRDWYAERSIHYFVLHEGDESEEIRQEVQSIAGEPDHIYDLGDYELLWYESDLSSHLTNGLYDNVLTADEMIPASETGVHEESADAQAQDMQGSCWFLPKSGRVGAYGVSLAPGTWRLTFSGDNLKSAAISVTSDKLGELGVIYPDAEIPQGSAAPEGSESGTADLQTVSLTIRLPEAVEDITITVENTAVEDGNNIRLDQITSEKL